MKHDVLKALSVLAAVALASGCSGGRSTATSQSLTTSDTSGPIPASNSFSTSSEQSSPEPGSTRSALLPAIALPKGSTFSGAQTEPSKNLGFESWSVPMPFGEVEIYLKDSLPIGDTFADAKYRGEESTMELNGDKKTEWTWAGEADEFISVAVAEVSERTSVVAIVRSL